MFLIFFLAWIAIQYLPYLFDPHQQVQKANSVTGLKSVISKTPLKYDVVFDVSQGGYSYSYLPIVGLSVLALVILFFIAQKKWPAFFEEKLKFFSLMAFCTFVWILCNFTVSFLEYNRMKQALINNNCEMVEGPVQDFIPRTKNGTPGESFSVKSIKFSYTYWTVASEFHITQPFGGPIKEGLKVRIYYVPAKWGPKIAKLEIAGHQ